MDKNAIAGKIVFITGGSSGLGEATARYLAARGAKLVIAARRKDRLDKIVTDIKAAGGQALALELDVTRAEAVKAAIAAAVKHYGRLDVLINNAGLMAIAPMSQTRLNEWDRMVDINIKGVLYGIAAALPIFEKQKSGHFVNISSVAGIKVFAPGGTVYSGTKYAVRAISDGLRQEVGAHIRVTTVEPGAVDSELKYGSEDKASRDFVLNFYQAAIPAESVARAIAYAIEQPANVDINEIALRPTAQEF
ncbi:MAG: SDR family NAD(P)-dependent oxidoreductase [Candidatus Tokpelaia sp.]|uniref:SDR family oxidoreductase n=1 Tax=Candidatus Tokpelaia sp. TaxID=2233777 RepID=UPI0012395A19|nr:SDR family oxidoreductase [Candidatus Tokpelaia sp.]KAA6205226.1 MAG: SDR family NAD(P)-dependent oxidoreductase [Candidatus Tokpelaia sp.]KAA6207439.1 MAG: SDR family NAD(P)-dependent oxidoreductase [Candidatus Tokpelaia sp.]KAA6405689.1 oxidoreductase [Candidatus Tokpelaia sp.]